MSGRSMLLHSIGQPIAFHPGLVPILGSVNAVLFFGQIFYWQDKAASDLGVYKSSEEIQHETGLTYREQANAREKLRACGVLIETEKRLEHRIYFRVDFDALDALLANCGNSTPRNDKSAVRGTTKAQPDETTKAQPVIQRLPVSTSEITSEIKSKGAPSRSMHIPASDLVALGVSHQVADDFLTIRKSCKAPLTKTALDGIRNQSEKAGLTLDAALRICAERGWRSFKAEWHQGDRGKKNSHDLSGKNWQEGINPDGSF